jgi:hypothetical protein
MIPWKLVASVVGLGASVLPLAAVAVAGWGRTGPLRRGSDIRGANTRPDTPMAVRTSRLTFVPAVGGVWVTAGGLGVALGDVVGAGRGPPGPALAVAACGSIIAWAGWSRRVVRLRLGPKGLSIVYRRGPSFDVRWESLARVTPP